MIRAGACNSLFSATERLGLGYGHADESCSLLEERNAQGFTALLTAFAIQSLVRVVSCKRGATVGLPN